MMSRSTKFCRQKYQYFIDMQTDATRMQVINITAGGRMPQIRLNPFFAAYKYFKLGKIKIRFVPAATLPVDPTGLSYEAGDQTVDPRDQMNPGLVRITNGEDVSNLTSIFTGTSAERAYYSTMLDPRWYKFSLQSGFKRTASPRFWKLAQPKQSVTQFHIENQAVEITSASDALRAYAYGNLLTSGEDDSEYWQSSRITGNGYQFTNDDFMQKIVMQNGTERMNWMPTDMFNSNMFGLDAVPEVNVITVVLPKAYKTKYFYRCYVEEEILFKDPVSMFPIVATYTGTGSSISALNYLNTGAVDRFTNPGLINPNQGGSAFTASHTFITGTNKINGGANIAPPGGDES